MVKVTLLYMYLHNIILVNFCHCGYAICLSFTYIIASIVINVMFSQSTYSVIENAEPARPTLVLNNPSSTSFTVQVTNTDGSAIGEH